MRRELSLGLGVTSSQQSRGMTDILILISWQLLSVKSLDPQTLIHLVFSSVPQMHKTSVHFSASFCPSKCEKTRSHILREVNITFI